MPQCTRRNFAFNEQLDLVRRHPTFFQQLLQRFLPLRKGKDGSANLWLDHVHHQVNSARNVNMRICTALITFSITTDSSECQGYLSHFLKYFMSRRFDKLLEPAVRDVHLRAKIWNAKILRQILGQVERAISNGDLVTRQDASKRFVMSRHAATNVLRRWPI